MGPLIQRLYMGFSPTRQPYRQQSYYCDLNADVLSLREISLDQFPHEAPRRRRRPELVTTDGDR